MIKQCKAYDYSRLPQGKLPGPGTEWFVSTKYDGHYVQICINLFTEQVTMYTSGGKPFVNVPMANELLKAFNDKSAKKLFGNNVTLEGEYLGQAMGKLGDRGEAAVITTMRKEYERGIDSHRPNDKLMIFDFVDTKAQFHERARWLSVLAELLCATEARCVGVVQNMITTEPFKIAQELMADGWEGVIAKSPYHTYIPGKRVANAFKIKERKSKDLVCVDATEGLGKYEGKIGALVLEDEHGKTYQVGSGLSDEVRNMDKEDLYGKVVTISYERYTDTFIQPVIIAIGD